MVVADLFSILFACAIGVWVFRRSTPSGRRLQVTLESYRTRPLASTAWTIIIVGIVYMIVAGKYHLASVLYDTQVPTREELKAAKALIAAFILVPMAAVFGRILWRARKAEPVPPRRPHAPMLDASKQSDYRQEQQ